MTTMKYTKMVRTHHYYLSGKNKISIFQRCIDLQNGILYCLCRLFLALLVCLLFSYTLRAHFNATNISGQQHRRATADLKLHNKVRIFCVINTYAARHDSVAVHVQRTWAKRCNHYLFVSDEMHGQLEPVVFGGINDKWLRMRATLDYVYKYHYNDADWFLQANDDNFISVENLRYLLMHKDPNAPIYFGCKLLSDLNETFMYTGSGIAFSKETLRRFVVEAMPNHKLCSNQKNGHEGIELARCLRNFDVQPENSLDPSGHHTFLPFKPEIHLKQGMRDNKYQWFLEKSYHKVTNHMISRRAISFHFDYMPKMYNINYFAYKVKLFGTITRNMTINSY